MYDFYGECVRRGYTLSDEPIFNIQERQDFLSGRIDGTPSPLLCLRPRKAGKDRRADAAGVPGAFGAVLRGLFQRGRNVADHGPGGEGTGTDARGTVQSAVHRHTLHWAGDRNKAVLLKACVAGERLKAVEAIQPLHIRMINGVKICYGNLSSLDKDF